MSACVLGCMLWKEGGTLKRHEEDKGGRLSLLGKFTGILDVPGTTRLWGRGTGTIVGVVTEMWGCCGVHRNKAKKRSPFERGHKMLDSAMFVY